MAAWGYGLLGPVEVRVDGRALPLPGARQRLLLAVLLVNANRMVPAVRLIDELWGADLPADPRAALRTQVARLRRALGPAGQDLATLEGGYRLTVPRGGLDVCRFEDALAEAARADGEPALRLLDEAVGLCRGPALGELADRPFALATAARLEELRVAAAERQAELQLSLGRADEAVAGLGALLAEHPEREQARGLLMQALYRTGRQTEALATIRSWRRHLATELGLDPSPALQAIEQDILRHTAGTPDTRGAAAPLPLPVTSFVGRDEELVAVTARLDRARLVTLHGPGGVGKTRLAVEVAERTGGSYRDGVCFCDLAAVTEPHAVVRAVATAAGLSERAFRRLDDQLVEHLADRHLLLVLDNCEHVAQAAAVLAERLLKQTRGVTLLATSRERLEVDGEHVWQVRPLPVSGHDAPAVRLFLDRARAADPAVARQDPDIAAVAGLCASLDGLPLAIELAAARLPGTTVSELAGNLRDRFGLLTVGRRAGGRHRSLRAVVDWSYEQLTAGQQDLFAQLAVFHGSFEPLPPARSPTGLATWPRSPASCCISPTVPWSPPSWTGTRPGTGCWRPCAAMAWNGSPSAGSWTRPGRGTHGGPRTWSRGPNAGCAAPPRPAGRARWSGMSAICAPPTPGCAAGTPNSACGCPLSCTGMRSGAATPRSTAGPTPARRPRPDRAHRSTPRRSPPPRSARCTGEIWTRPGPPPAAPWPPRGDWLRSVPGGRWRLLPRWPPSAVSWRMRWTSTSGRTTCR